MNGPSRKTGTVTYVLFDFFGTLVTNSEDLEQGWEPALEFLSASGIDLDYEASLHQWQRAWDDREAEALRTTREFPMTDVVRDFLMRATGRPPSRTLVTEFTDFYLSEWNKGVVYTTGLGDMLARLAEQFELAIITNTHHPSLVPDHLTRMGISSYFSTVVTSVEHGYRKPNPIIFRDTLEALGASSEGCVYVGDSFGADYVGAGSAGIRALLIDPTEAHTVPASDRLSSILALEGALPDVRF